MGAGFGTLPSGTGSFGTQAVSDQVLSESVSISESLTPSVPFKVAAASSLSTTLVKLDFTGFVDIAHASNFDPANYTIAGLAIVSVNPFGATKSVILQTSTQLHSNYTLVVNSTPGLVQAVGGDQLDPLFDTATFLGDAVPVTFTAVAQSRRKVRLTFAQPMLFDAAFANPASFLLAGLTGEGITLEAIQQVDGSGLRFQLVLEEELVPFASYSLQVTSSVRSAAGDTVFPDVAMLQWKEVIPKPIRISIGQFSGEVAGGLLGTPAGQVFFSPALGVSAPNSVIQVDSVEVCTRASDVYRIPAIPDPSVLYTYPPPIGTSAVLGAAGGVLRASAHRLGLALMALSDLQAETVAAPTDSDVTGTLEEPIDITRAAFLNDGRWRTFPATGASLGAFRTADNQTPIGPGSTIGPFAIP